MALLPGFEEENEISEKAYCILDDLCRDLGEVFFYHCLWIGIISSPRSRFNGLVFLLKKLGNQFSKEDIGILIGSEPGLMVRAISESLTDSSVLVQRNALDFLLKYLPFESCRDYFKNLSNVLIFSALKTVLRRDMSLNRRLYSWLLVQDSSSKQNTEQLTLEVTIQIVECLKVVLIGV